MKHFADVGAAVVSLIPQKYPSDAAFERAAGLPPKTVSNWRRGRSATYMKMLPQLEALLGDELRDLIRDEEGEGDGLTREEARLLRAWRATADMTPTARKSLYTMLMNMMKLSLGGSAT